jgi:hypothetical protein
MNFWEPGLPETLYTIAMFLFVAILIAPLLNWSSTDDTRTVDDDTTDMEIER